MLFIPPSVHFAKEAKRFVTWQNESHGHTSIEAIDEWIQNKFINF